MLCIQKTEKLFSFYSAFLLLWIISLPYSDIREKLDNTPLNHFLPFETIMFLFVSLVLAAFLDIVDDRYKTREKSKIKNHTPEIQHKKN